MGFAARIHPHKFHLRHDSVIPRNGRDSSAPLQTEAEKGRTKKKTSDSLKRLLINPFKARSLDNTDQCTLATILQVVAAILASRDSLVG